MASKIEGLPIQKEWVVVSVKEGAVEDNPNGPGQLQKFYVDFEGAPDVYWRRKLPATVDVGKSYFGTISEGKHGPIFKKENPNSSGGARSGSGGGGARPYKPESEFDPEKVRRIGRAHAQSMAVQTLTAMGTFEGKSAEQLHSTLKEWIDWFEQDVNAAAAEAKPAPAAQPAQAEPAAPPPQPVDLATLRNLCEAAGLDPLGAQALAGFIDQRLSDEQKQRAKSGLEANTAETLGKLREAYEQSEEQALPAEDDDIPF
jgi:hypothetical protein